MANVDSAFGLRPVRHANGSPYNGAVEIMALATGETNAIFIGSPVKSAGSANADGIPTCTLAGAGDKIRGAVVGFDVDPDNLSLQYRTASTARLVKVASDPGLVFEVQEDGVGGALAVTAVGNVANLTAEVGNTTFGNSTVELDTNTAGTGTDGQVMILGFVQREDNEVGSANAKVLVRIAEHELGPELVGV